jgi:hypothetical protein
MEPKKFPFRIDQLPVFGGYIHTSLVRDEANFAPYLKYITPFPANYLTELGLVEEAISPVIYIREMKVITFNIITGSYGLRSLINNVEIFANSAGSLLSVLPKDMGMSEVRDAINRDDVPALLLAGKNLNTNIANNSTVLIGVGFLLVAQEALVAAFLTIKTNNDLQNSMRSTRSGATAGNMILFNNFWNNFMSPTRTTGALIFKISDAAKYKDYVIAQMKARSRRDEAQTQVHGNVTDAAGHPVNKAKVKLMPVDGGRTRTVYTDAEGNYVVSGMRATAYNQVVTKGALLKINAVTVLTRVHLEVNSVVV